MPNGTILVSQNAKDQAHVVLCIARELAREHQAGLNGIYVVPDAKPSAMLEACLEADFCEDQQKRFSRCSDTMRRPFKKEAFSSLLMPEWVQVCATNHTLADDRIAHCGQADLIVLNQTVGGETSLDREPDLAERLVMAPDRPVLVSH